MQTYKTEDRAAARVDVVRHVTGAWPAIIRVTPTGRAADRRTTGYRLTFDPDIAAGERAR
jgi:hypothetical protein